MATHDIPPCTRSIGATDMTDLMGKAAVVTGSTLWEKWLGESGQGL